jgi:hypothetical protein
MDVTFGNFGKVEISWKIAVITTMVGLALYYCDWIEFFSPGFSGFCLWSSFDFSLYFIILMLTSGVMGYFGFKEPLMYWILLMVPSWIIRVIMINETKSNVYPIVIGLDFIFQIMLPGFVLDIVARIRRRHIVKKNRAKVET